jgi:hypothetical protein
MHRGIFQHRHALSGFVASLMAFAAGAATAEPQSAATWTRNVSDDGSATMSLAKRLPTEWETSVGVDLGLLPETPPPTRPEPILLNPHPGTSSAAGWARMSVPVDAEAAVFDRASVELRVDPLQDQAKLGATLSRSLPLGDNISVNLRNSYSLTRAGPGTGAPPETVGMDNSLGLRVAPTKTTLSAGTALSSADNAWHSWASAEQKVFGNVNVTATLSEIGREAPVKSITAGYRRTW